MGKMCLVHKETPALAMCHQCHKPICRACTLVTGTGSFCSTDCHQANLMFHRRYGTALPRRRFAAGTLLLVILALVIGFFVLVHFSGKMGDLDVIGKLLRFLKSR